MFLPSPALAAARPHNDAATDAYLLASGAYARGAYSQLRVSAASIEDSVHQVAAECPSALTYAPRDAAFTELGEEAQLTLWFAASKPLLSSIMRFAQAIGHLSWSDHTLTRLVRAQAAEEREIAVLTLPDLCADIRPWKASAYAVLPQTVSAFVARGSALEYGSSIGPSEEPREAVILRRLRHYEGRIERAAAKRIEALEARLGRRLGATLTSAQAKLAAALGVSRL
jgi:hypothetical protein